MEAVYQLVYSCNAVPFNRLRQVSISCGCRRTGVTQKGLDMTQAQATFKKVGGITVPESMDGYFFLILQVFTIAFIAHCAAFLLMRLPDC